MTKRVDVVIAGSGAAGMLAAIRAAESGLSCVLLEKGRSIASSNAARCGGPALAQTRLQEREGETVTAERLFSHMYGFSRGTVNAGLLRAARYFLRDRYETMMRRDLSVGLILMAAGGFLILRMDAVISLLPFVFGLMLLGGCAGKLQTAVDLRRVGSGMWPASLLMAAVSLALGIVLLCQPFESAMVLTRFIGVAITLEGAENLAALPIFDRQIQDFYDRNDDIERR